MKVEITADDVFNEAKWHGTEVTRKQAEKSFSLHKENIMGRVQLEGKRLIWGWLERDIKLGLLK